MTTKDTIRAWFNSGLLSADEYAHMAVYWDSFDGPDGDYPVYITAISESDAKSLVHDHQDRLMEVYSYAVPLEDQIDLPRSYTYTM